MVNVKSFQDGKVSMTYAKFLGYKHGEDGIPVIDEDEAETVWSIYKMYLSGMGLGAIAEKLSVDGKKTQQERAFGRLQQ